MHIMTNKNSTSKDNSNKDNKKTFTFDLKKAKPSQKPNKETR